MRLRRCLGWCVELPKLGATSYIIVSDQPFNCIFTPSAGGPVQYYQANIHRVGAQVGFSSNVALGWAVFATTPATQLELYPVALPTHHYRHRHPH